MLHTAYILLLIIIFVIINNPYVSEINPYNIITARHLSVLKSPPLMEFIYLALPDCIQL